MRQKFALFWPKVGASYFPKREFCGKVDQHCFGLTIVSQHGRILSSILKSYWHILQVICKLNSKETFNKWRYFRLDLTFQLSYFENQA